MVRYPASAAGSRAARAKRRCQSASPAGAIPSSGRVRSTVYRHLCPALAPSLAERLTAGRYDGALGQGLLHVLVKYGPRAALPVCKSIAGIPGHDLASAARRGLAELDPAALVALLVADPAEPRNVADLVEHINLGPLDDPQLTAPASLLLRVASVDSDPPPQYGVFNADRLHQVRRIRRIVMDLLAEHGQDRFFRDLAARNEGGGRAGRTPGWRDDSDLLDLVLLQLDDLQRELTQRGASRRLWDFNGAHGTPKDKNTISEFVRDELMVRLRAQ
jgi:hypothetical protein